jgi:CubicO group peptidase (beta-lactamase class C family)
MAARHRTARVLALCATLTSAPIARAVQDPPLERVRQAALAEIAAGSMPGLAVAVVHNGRMILSEGFGVASSESGAPVIADTVFQAGSAAKMLTAAAVLEASANGILALHRPIRRASHGLAPAIGALTPHQLLTHTSGMRDMPGAHGELGDEAHGRFLRSLADADRILPPGHTFSYSNLGYSLAGLALADAMGVDFATAMARLVIEPVGMQRSTLRPTIAMTWPLSMGHQQQKDGSFAVVRPMAHDARLWPAGYAFTTARDLARFAMTLLEGGRIDGRELLRPQTVTQMMTPHVELPALFEGWRYGYGLFLMRMRGLNVAEHAGSMVGFAALIRLVPAHRFAVIALSNSETPAIRTVDAAMEALLPVESPKPRAEDNTADVPVAELRPFVGRYENRGRFALALESSGSVLRQNDGPALPVRRTDTGVFVAAGPNNQPRLRFLLRPAAGEHPATLHFALWAYPKLNDAPRTVKRP